MTSLTVSRTADIRGSCEPRLRDLPRGDTGEVSAAPASIDLEALSARWQRALDAVGRSLSAASNELPASELRDRRVALTRETEQTAVALRELARDGRQPVPWLSPTPVTNRMLGLLTTVRACVFDVEGVLTDSSLVHAWAWGEALDGYLARLGETTGRHFIRFDRITDYREYMEGRSRLEGVHAFLRSRGIQVHEGLPGDPGDARTAHGLARRKGELVQRRLQERGVTSRPGARRYLEAARRAGVLCAVISESTSAFRTLRQARLEPLIDVVIDAAVIDAEGLRSRPAPDLPFAACRRLELAPDRVVTFTSSPAGIVAGRSAGMSTTIAVGADAHRETFEGFGAEQLVPSLSSLLDARLKVGLVGSS